MTVSGPGYIHVRSCASLPPRIYTESMADACESAVAMRGSISQCSGKIKVCSHNGAKFNVPDDGHFSRSAHTPCPRQRRYGRGTAPSECAYREGYDWCGDRSRRSVSFVARFSYTTHAIASRVNRRPRAKAKLIPEVLRARRLSHQHRV